MTRMRTTTPGRAGGAGPLSAALTIQLLLAFLAPGHGAAARGVVDECRYASDAEARAAWSPMQGTAPARTGSVDGRRTLRLECNFAGTTIPRASWDRKVQLNLSSCRGLQFQLLCREATPISYFSLYLQSGEGWYHASFYPEDDKGWNTITVDKAEMKSEGQPAGWDQIRTIRLSAWRGGDESTEFYLSDLRQTGLLGEDAAVAVVRADWAAQRAADQAPSLRQAAETVADVLASGGVGSAMISDMETTAERLQGARLVVLPYNPVIPDACATALTDFLRNGGKLLAFYAVPEQLLLALQIEKGRHTKAPRDGYFSALRFSDGAIPGAPRLVRQSSWNIDDVKPGKNSRVLAEWIDNQGQATGHAAILGSSNWAFMSHVLLPDDRANKERMLLALAGYLAPELWREAVSARMRDLGKIASCQSFEEAAQEIGAVANKPAAQQALAQARKLRESASRLAAAGNFAEALSQAESAEVQLREAYCLAQTSLPGEFRGFWCHSAFGVKGISWDEAVRRLAANGFTAILPNMLWGGAAYYESQVLPVAREVRERGDQIKECLAACRKYGVEAHIWKVNWNLGSAAPKEFLEKMRQEKRLQLSAKGKEEPWLCPSHPENQKLEIDSMVEVARNYDVDGIHFDYIRYPDSDHCFCEGCRKRFGRMSGGIEKWPADVLPEGPLHQQWLDWRRNNITTVVKAVSEQVRAIKPKIKISAAVFRYWTVDRDNVGQDWKLWCDKRFVDFVCPMDYTPINRRFETMVSRQVQWAGKRKCYPGLGVSASSSKFGADRAIEQIEITRRYKTGGFVIFNYGVRESEELLPLLGKGITSKANP